MSRLAAPIRRCPRQSSQSKNDGGNRAFPRPGMYASPDPLTADWLAAGEDTRAQRESRSDHPAPVLVVPAEPELPRLALVAALGGVVEDRVVAHEELQAAPRRRVRVVHVTLVAHERAEAGALREVADRVGAGRAGVVLDDRRQPRLRRLGPRAAEILARP